MPFTPLRRDFVAAGGFTLIELMVVVVVATILLTIAIPTYQAQIRKSRRTEAKTALLDLASREERYFSTTPVYTNTATNLGYASWGPIGSNYYQLNQPTLVSSNGAPGFTVSATAINSQTKDTACQYFSVDNLGVQLAGASAGTAVTGSTCWQ